MEEIGSICMFMFITNSYICPEITESTYLLAHLTDECDCTWSGQTLLSRARPKATGSSARQLNA